MGLSGQKIKAELHSCCRPKEIIHFLAFSTFQRLPMLVDPWPTSTCNARSHSTLLCPHMLPGLLPHSFIYKELCDQIERKQIIQYNLLISTSLIYSHLQNLFCFVRFLFPGSKGCSVHMQQEREGALFCLPQCT